LLLVTNLKGGGTADAEKNQASTKVKIVEAKVDVPAHAILTIDQLLEREVASSDVPSDAVGSISEVVGQAYRVPLSVGQPLLRSQIEVPGLRNDVAAGKRAIALPVNDVSAMSGLVQDGDYVDIIFHARIDLVPAIQVEDKQGAGSETQSAAGESQASAQPTPPIAGDPGSTFFIHDDVGEAGELEPVAKIMLQDMRVLRVVRPGDQFMPDGTLAQETLTDGAAASEPVSLGQLILEVSPEQAELVTFIQDAHHQYQVIVRSKDDHETVTTAGITYEILATEPEWSLPWPKAVTVPESNAKGSSKSENNGG
jgi:pilus assembly protein CpaB